MYELYGWIRNLETSGISYLWDIYLAFTLFLLLLNYPIGCLLRANNKPRMAFVWIGLALIANVCIVILGNILPTTTPVVLLLFIAGTLLAIIGIWDTVKVMYEQNFK